MNPISFIPAQYQVYARVSVLLLLAGACFLSGWHINGWRLASTVADVQVEHANAVSKATAAALTQLKTVTADRDRKAAALAAIDAAHQDELTRLKDENDSLRDGVRTGSRVVRIRATCPDPARGTSVPAAAGGGGVDPGAGAVLAPEDGQAVLDLRADAIRVGKKLDACQASLGCLTGQRACPPGGTTP